MPPLNTDEDGLISEFRGIPYFASKQKKHFTKGKSEEIGSIVSKIFENLKIGQKTPQKVIAENWQSIVYGEFSKLSSPYMIRGNVLYIKTENPSIRQHLSFDKKEILKNVNALASCENIKEIRFA